MTETEKAPDATQENENRIMEKQDQDELESQPLLQNKENVNGEERAEGKKKDVK